MKFPQLLVDVDAYYARLEQLILDNECHIFFDTNIISQMYRLNSNARSEFYVWLDSIKDRTHVPNWAIHEYTNRFLTEKTSDYLGELNKLSSLPKQLIEVTNFLRMYVDDCLFANSRYQGNKDLLFQELDSIINGMSIISKALDRKSIQNVKLQVHQEMLDKFQAIALESDVCKLLEEVGFYQSFRYESKYPPGFKDNDKEYNLAGDLLLWQEILQYCKAKTIKKVILVTRDMKKDFVYAPKRVKEGGIEKSNQDDKLKIADERLVGEFSSKTGSDIFYIINFQQLAGVLSKTSPSQYRNLAVSVQIDPYFVSQTVDDENENIDSPEETISEINDIIEMPNTENTETNVFETSPGITENFPVKQEISTSYSLEALKDKMFALDEGNKLHAIINDLRIHNWASQNSAVENLYSLSVSDFEVIDVIINSFFVLGRNVYQAACGNAFKAISLIENLSSFLSNIGQRILRKAFLDGALYEVYFNHENEYRKEGCRGDYLRPLESCLKQSEYIDSLEFIKEKLEMLSAAYICYPPLYAKCVTISLSGKLQEVEFSNSFVVNQMEIDGKIADYQNFRYAFPYLVNIEVLKTTISRLFAVDKDLIIIEGLPDEKEYRAIIFNYPLPF